MVDLEPVAGLPLSLDEETGRLSFGPGVRPVEPDVRRLEAMREVLRDPRAGGPEELYFMYRGLARDEEAERIRAAGVRYDVTVLVDARLGQEPVKTYGHYHPLPPGGRLAYPEVYQVLYGRAHFLLQKRGAGDDELEDVVIVDAGPGDVVVMPPGYGHVTINPGPGPLAMANWVDASFASDYRPYARAHGAAYYELEEDGEMEWVENPHYTRLPDPRALPPRDLRALGLEQGRPMYPLGAADPGRIAWLSRPDERREALLTLTRDAGQPG
ncbi:MAG: glucose-6-phosphate isomerase family protein [Bacillota bacterium]|nr:glucose-6-phosphate isomerase family protein [Bacillota bacterium]